MAQPKTARSKAARPKPVRRTAAPARMSHFDRAGRARMVDVAAKPDTHRVAVACGVIRMAADTLRIIAAGSASKGDVLGVARIAGIQAAKRTSDLVPLCHPLALTKVELSFGLDEANPGVEATARVETLGKTGVEMEALTAVSVTLLTLYDMAKALDKGMVLGDIRLLTKTGGKSGDWRAEG